MGVFDLVRLLSARVSSLEKSLAEMKAELAEVKASVQRLDDVADTLQRIYGLLKWVASTGGATALGVLVKLLLDRVF